MLLGAGQSVYSIKAYIRKSENAQINDLMLQLKKKKTGKTRTKPNPSPKDRKKQYTSEQKIK